ncbi:uncharacterized protein BDV14DRAFT_206952 [Aspergillus stella-maris]|uniref:uncharacterized protein n=1 Tax=Aspergillus stella-maris TaxID=1810926 RepID=UPI003CCDA23F
METANTPQERVGSLPKQYLQPLLSTVRRIFSSQRAEYVFGQVVEGTPTKETARFKHHNDNPAIEDRAEPLPDTLNLVRTWRSSFELASLEIDLDVLKIYWESRLGTREAKLRLIEITAVIIHHLAALLFEHTNQPPNKRPEAKNGFAMVDGYFQRTDEIIESLYPTYLFHNHYLDSDIYPMGVADIVAYWAETHLFGGVFLDVLLHPDNRFQIFKLSDAQIDQFIGFGLYGEPTFPCPFPMKTERDTVRLSGEHTMHLNVYRSKNDRKVPEEPPRLSCVRRA